MLVREHRPEDFLTQICPTAYDDKATCPRWDTFVPEVFGGDMDLARWVQKFFGYCMTGYTREQVMAVFWGDGANGKSTMLNVVRAVMGNDYSCDVPTELFMSKGYNQHPAVNFILYRKRLAVARETESGGKLNEERIKMLTGGDPIPCRRMHENWWEFLPTHKLVLVTNHKPEVSGVDHAIWRRLRLVPFTQKFAIDPALEGILVAEAEGVLQWMLRGLTMWLEEGLGDVPAAMRAAEESYRSEQDQVEQFLEERCTKGEGLKVRTSELTQAYNGWCHVNRKRQMESKMFGRVLTEKGFALDPTRKFRAGLSLST